MREGRGGGGCSDKRPPTFPNCYRCFNKSFFHKKKYDIVFYFRGSIEPPLDLPQVNQRLFKSFQSSFPAHFPITDTSAVKLQTMLPSTF